MTVFLATGNCQFHAEPTRSRSTPTANVDASRKQGRSAEYAEAVGPLHDSDEPNRWLKVLAVQKNARGAYGKGSFDAARNRIDIRTRDVKAFSVDISKIPIDWSRAVVIRIDGISSELRRREHPVLHFHWDEHCAWSVVEPPRPPN